MEEDKKKLVCELLENIEAQLTIEMLTYWKSKKISEFWNAVESLGKFLEMKNKICR